jgi:uroporphyrinogen decarboxylase
MTELTTHDRMTRVYEHRDPDRIPIIDGIWGATLERWRREGMPETADWRDFFGLDKVAHIGVDNSPRYPTEVVAEDDVTVTRRTCWGGITRDFKHSASVPECLDFTIKSADTWREAKARMTPSRDRVDWAHLAKNYRSWRESGHWIQAGFMFGFDVSQARCVGTERFLIAMVTEPEWCVDMFNAQLDLGLALLDMVWDEGYRFDAFGWPDDMGFRGKQFFSLTTYRDLLKPVHQRAVEWAHAKGIKAHLHSCGNIRPFVPELVAIGIDSLNPLEVKAGMDPVAIKREFGDRLVLHGGTNVLIWDKPGQLRAEMERILPILKENGGYIFASDHSIPSSVGLEDFRRIVADAKRIGSYA